MPFQDNGLHYPTLHRMALDFLLCQASSVPCEQLFLGGGEIMTKRQAWLGAAQFEELQMMKFAWRNNMANLAAWNSAQVEEVHKLKEYEDLLIRDTEQGNWDFKVSFAEEEISEF